MYVFSDCAHGRGYTPASGGPLLLTHTYVKSWTVLIRRQSPEVSFPKFSNNSKHQISTKWFDLHIWNKFQAELCKFPCSPARCQDAATLHQTAIASSHVVPVSPSVIVKCLAITSTATQRHYIPTAIALQLCSRIRHYEGPGKPGGAETEWGTPTSGL
jgi:hypothetical protein